MTGDHSRKLKVGAKVCWENELGAKGAVTENGRSAVKIKWDNGVTSEVMHNDMGLVKVLA